MFTVNVPQYTGLRASRVTKVRIEYARAFVSREWRRDDDDEDRSIDRSIDGIAGLRVSCGGGMGDVGVLARRRGRDGGVSRA